LHPIQATYSQYIQVYCVTSDNKPIKESHVLTGEKVHEIGARLQYSPQ